MNSTEYRQSRDALSLGDIKVAALYFDRVFGLGLAEFELIDTFNYDSRRSESKKMIATYHSATHARALASLIYGPSTKRKQLDSDALIRVNNVQEIYRMIWDAYDEFRDFNHRTGDPDYVGKTRLQRIHECAQLFVKNAFIPRLNAPVRKIIKDWVRTFGGMNDYSLVFPNEFEASSSSSATDALVTLSGIPIIDAARLTWDQIVEVREDSDARARLRRLRLFLHEHYAGKSQAFVEDDLLRRIDEFKDACKKHSLETKIAVMDTILSAKNLASATAATFLSGFVGGIGPAVSAATILEIGQVSLTLLKRRSMFKNLRDENELSYVFHLQNKSLPSLTSV